MLNKILVAIATPDSNSYIFDRALVLAKATEAVYVSKAKAAGISIDCIHCFGDPEAAINDFALVWKPSLIVLGRRRRSGIAEFFLGSVSNYTLHHAQCSIYVVQEPSSI
jgi:nucleotide-binding universal stress UspA family protein